LYIFFRYGSWFVFVLILSKTGEKRGKRRCKSLIIKVFQRSSRVNFTYRTWNNNFGGAKSLFLLILLLLYIYIYRVCSSVPAILEDGG